MKVKITKEQIEKYNSSFITEELRNQEADIIYRIKDRNIFFLIEHQTKIDYTMPLRILEYENEIIKSAIDKTKLGRKDYKYPRVISIVLYSGRKKWKVEDYISKVQEKLEGYEEAEFAKYNIVDVNNYTEEELLKEESFLSKALLIEKTRYSSKLASYLEKIVEELNTRKDVYSKEQKDLLITIINLVLSRKLNKENTESLIKKLEIGGKPMLAVLEMIDEENKRLIEHGRKLGKREGKREGKKEGKKVEKIEIAKRLLKSKVPLEIIINATKLTEEEIKNIKIEL